MRENELEIAADLDFTCAPSDYGRTPNFRRFRFWVDCKIKLWFSGSLSWCAGRAIKHGVKSRRGGPRALALRARKRDDARAIDGDFDRARDRASANRDLTSARGDILRARNLL